MENHQHHPSTTVNNHHHSPPPPPPVTRTTTSCNPSTTFIQTDPSSFKQVVQLLTGQQQQPTRTKLYERRPMSKSFMISPLVNNSGGVFSSPEVLSPSLLNFPGLVLSPVTPLLPDPFCLDYEAEEKAIKEGGFYLHKSPRGGHESPRLLPLFPMREENSSSSSSE